MVSISEPLIRDDGGRGSPRTIARDSDGLSGIAYEPHVEARKSNVT